MDALGTSFAEDPSPAGATPPSAQVRVGMLASVFAPSVGGIQTHTLRLGQRLAARGARVHVVTRIQRGLPRFERLGEVRVHRVGLASARGKVGSAAYVAGAVAAVVRLAPELDVLHAHQLLSPTTAGLAAARLTGLPLVLNPHACGPIGDVGLLRAGPIGRARLRAAVRGADAFVAVSGAIAEELRGAGVAPEALWRIGNGVDTERFRPAPAEERAALRRVLGLDAAPLVVYAGRLAPEKGPDVLLAAWPLLLRRVPAARLLVLGDGAEAPALRAAAARLGGSVTLAGPTPDVAPWLRAGDAFALPSRTEGLPVALLEAMSCGLPSVASRVGGAAEVVVDGETGRLVPPDDPAALAAGLAEALLHQAPGAGWGAAARAWVLGRASIDLVVDQFLALYARLTARRVAARGIGALPEP